MSKDIPMCACCSLRHHRTGPHCQWCINHPKANPRANAKPGPKGRKRNRIW